MKLDEMVLSDGRKLIDVWPEVTMYASEGAARLVSIPEGSKGHVFVEYGTGAKRCVDLYQFFEGGESEFFLGAMLAEKKS